MKLLTKLVLGALTVTMMSNITGCKRSNESKVENGSNQATLKMVWWGNDQRKDVTNKVIELFQKKHPNIKFETKNYANTSAIRIDLAMNTADEVLPDIMQMNYDYIYSYANRKLLEPLNPYVDEKILNLSDVDKSYLDGGMKDGQIYALNLAINAYCIAVNPSVFKKAGIPIPESGYTYDEMYQIAKELKTNINDPDFYPLANFPDFNTFVRSTGATYYNSNGTGLGYDNDKVFTDYVNIQKKWLTEGLIASTSVTNGRSDKDALIVLGRSAFHFAVSNNIAGLSSYANQVLKIISVPSATKGKITSAVRPSMFFGVSAYSNYKKEAVEFVDFFINDIDANNILMGERGVPVSSKVSDNLLSKVKDSEKEQYLFMKYIKEHPSQIDPPYPSTTSIVGSLFSRLSGKVLNGSLTPEEGAKQFRSGTNNILNGIKGE